MQVGGYKESGNYPSENILSLSFRGLRPKNLLNKKAPSFGRHNNYHKLCLGIKLLNVLQHLNGSNYYCLPLSFLGLLVV